jgi:hypothetical protein
LAILIPPKFGSLAGFLGSAVSRFHVGLLTLTFVLLFLAGFRALGSFCLLDGTDAFAECTHEIGATSRSKGSAEGTQLVKTPLLRGSDAHGTRRWGSRLVKFPQPLIG